MTISSKLSKSQFLIGLQCPKALWFNTFRKDLKPEVDAATQAGFDAGKEISVLAQSYFFGGVEVTGNFLESAGAEKLTRELIENGHTTLYEAAAIHPTDGSHARIDVLKKVKDSNTWDLIEVKSSTEVKDYHLDDLSLQYHVFSGSGFRINKCYMMLVNNSYSRAGAINPKALFKLEDVSEQIIQKQHEVILKVETLTAVLESKSEPEEEIGARCKDPFECDFKQHCWKDVPNYSIYNVFASKKADMIAKLIDSYEVKNISQDLIPKGLKALDLEAFLTGKIIKDKRNISAFLDQLEYPLHYLDYETIGPAIPVYDGTRPYERIPFQFSLHIQRERDQSLEHYEFLCKEKIDPRERFIKTLVSHCGSAGSIIVYNKSFEASCNERLGDTYPEYSEALREINKRMVDLLIPFKRRWLYNPIQNGSASIKAVLPAFSTLSYKELEISGGEEASSKYLAFAEGKLSTESETSLFHDLSEYCSLDTYAMKLLIDKLCEI